MSEKNSGSYSQDPNRNVEVSNESVPPPPVQQRSSWKRWVFIGAGGCLMLVMLSTVLFVGCLAVIGSGDGESGGSTLSRKEIQEQAVPVGETIEVGDVAWTVTDVQRTRELKAFGQRKTGNFVVVDLTFTNNANEPVTLDSESLALLDNQGRTHETATDAEMYVPNNKSLFLEQVNPGVTRQGRAIFDIAPDALGLILRAGDAKLFTDEKDYVDLGI